MGRIRGIGVYAVSLLVMLLCVTAGTKASLVPYDPATMSYPTSVDQAMQAVRDWSGDPNISLEFKGIRDSQSEFLTDEYVFKTTDGLQSFEVDCDTGELYS